MAMLVMANAANMAYIKAIKKTRNKDYLAQNHPYWMQYFADNLPERITPPPKLLETRQHRKKRIMANSDSKYNRFAWFVYSKIISRLWFDVFILLNILAIGAVTGIDLEDSDQGQKTSQLITVVSSITSAVFTVEVVLKVVAEGPEPIRYFTDPEDGKFNTLDFFIVTAGYALIGVESGSAIGVLRMLRLVRLLTFIKGVPQLRAIVHGLAKGINSVSYIVLLLILIIYLFGIVGVLMLGENDPVRFGTVPMAMVSLFQVSTLASWTTVAYTSWYGCGNFNGDAYAAALGTDPPSRIHTMSGPAIGFQCNKKIANPIETFLFFSFFIVITSWVVMSLFIGVISMEMFEAFNDLKNRQKEQLYRTRLEENQEIDIGSDSEEEGEGGGGSVSSARKEGQSSREAKNATLKEKIEFALDEESHVYIPSSKLEYYALELVKHCVSIRDSTWFSTMVVTTIIVVGFMLGIDSDALKRCERRNYRESRNDDDSSCDSLFATMVVNNLALAVFALEALVKVIAEGSRPMRYFNDPDNGSWNRLDFFIVVIGFVEISGVSFLDFFPVVLLRLLRLLRVLRLTKAFPGLRAIVDALLSGLTSVGWICVLLVVFNYIAGCFCILLFGKNDPVHFGSVSTAMFTVFRMETLDSWDQVFNIAFYGCEHFPAGYDLVIDDDLLCQSNHATGFYGAAFLYMVVLFGAYILPTVLVGIVSINFTQATHRTMAVEKMREEMIAIENMAREVNPTFFNTERLEAIRAVFETMDADEELTLDLNEMTPFYHFVFDFVFNIELGPAQIEALFHLMDCDGDSELGFEEFLRFLVTIKRLDVKCREDPEYKKLAFPPDVMKQVDGAGSGKTWKRSMQKMDQDAVSKAWNRMLEMNHFEEGENLEHEIRQLFENFDSDGSNGLDYEELTQGLNSMGVLINSRQIVLMTSGMDQDKTGVITCDAFIKELDRRRVLRLKEFEEIARQEALVTLSNLRHLIENKENSSASDLLAQLSATVDGRGVKREIKGISEEEEEARNMDTLTAVNTIANIGAAPSSTALSSITESESATTTATSEKLALYKRRSLSSEDHPVEFTDSLQRLKLRLPRSQNRGTTVGEEIEQEQREGVSSVYLEEDQSKSLDVLMEECIQDMVTCYFVDTFKKKKVSAVAAVHEAAFPDSLSTRHVSEEVYTAMTMLLKDRLQSECHNFKRSRITQALNPNTDTSPSRSVLHMNRPSTPPTKPPPHAFHQFP